jgi:hypothetical protein
MTPIISGLDWIGLDWIGLDWIFPAYGPLSVVATSHNYFEQINATRKQIAKSSRILYRLKTSITNSRNDHGNSVASAESHPDGTVAYDNVPWTKRRDRRRTADGPAISLDLDRGLPQGYGSLPDAWAFPSTPSRPASSPRSVLRCSSLVRSSRQCSIEPDGTVTRRLSGQVGNPENEFCRKDLFPIARWD